MADIQESLNQTVEGLKVLHKQTQEKLDALQEKIEKIDHAVKSAMDLQQTLEELEAEQ